METAAWTRLAASLDFDALDPEGFAAAVGGLLRELAGPARTVTLARSALFVEAAVNPDLRRPIEAGRAELETWGAEWVRRLGSSDPVRHFWALMALIDGLLSHQCAVPDPHFDPVPAIRTLLRGLRL